MLLFHVVSVGTAVIGHLNEAGVSKLSVSRAKAGLCCPHCASLSPHAVSKSQFFIWNFRTVPPGRQPNLEGNSRLPKPQKEKVNRFSYSLAPKQPQMV